MSFDVGRIVFGMLPEGEDGTDEESLLDSYVNLLLVDGCVRPCALVRSDIAEKLDGTRFNVVPWQFGESFVSRAYTKLELGSMVDSLMWLRGRRDDKNFELLGDILGYPASSDFVECKRRYVCFVAVYSAKIPGFRVPVDFYSNVFYRTKFVPDYESQFDSFKMYLSKFGIRCIGRIFELDVDSRKVWRKL